MSGKREQRLRRKLRASQAALDRALVVVLSLRAELALAAVVVPIQATNRFPTLPPAPQRGGGGLDRRDLEVRRRELLNAGAKFGAEANKRHRNAERVAVLAAELDAAAKAFSLAESTCARRSA